MSAIEREVAHRDLENDLEEWARRWFMVGNFGRHIACRECLKVQQVRKASEAYHHLEGCPLTSDFAKYPWRELAEILRRLPVVE